MSDTEKLPVIEDAPPTGKSLRKKIEDTGKDMINDKLLKTFISTLLAIVGFMSKDEYESLKDGNILNYNVIVFIIFLCIIIYLGYEVAYRNKNKITIANNVDIFQNGVQMANFDIVDYMIHTMLPNASTTIDKLSIIKAIPDVFDLVPINMLEKTVASGFQIIAEQFSIAEIRAKDESKRFVDKMDKVLSDSSDTIRSLLSGKKFSDIKDDDLFPKDLRAEVVPATPSAKTE